MKIALLVCTIVTFSLGFWILLCSVQVQVLRIPVITEIANLDVGTRQFFDTNVISGNTYCYRICPDLGAGFQFSNIESTTTENNCPYPPPYDLTITSCGNTADLVWGNQVVSRMDQNGVNIRS